MKKQVIIGAVFLVLAVLFVGLYFWSKKNTAPQSPADVLLKQYSYDNVPIGLAAQHRVEAMSVHRVSGDDRLPIVNQYASKAVDALKKKELFVWVLTPENNARRLAYAQKNDAGDCVGFTASYALTYTGENRITGIEPSDLCREQDSAEREANEKMEMDLAAELEKSE